MLEGENSDLWEIPYREYDNIQVKPTFIKINSHMTAAQAMFRKASIRHILANEGADIVAGLGSDNFAKLVKDLTRTRDIDLEVSNRQKVVCKRIAGIEHHIRTKWGPVKVDEKEFRIERWQAADANILNHQAVYKLAIRNMTGATGHVTYADGNGYITCEKCGARGLENNAAFWS